MAEISALQVMALRKKTGAGIVDCKKALAESDGDETRAVEYLRVKGLATAADCSPPGALEAERRVYAEQAAESGKPPQVIEKMVEGKLQKFLKENALLNQTFVKNQPEEKDRTVQDYIKQHVAKLGENIQVARFVRFQLGEES